MNWDEFAKLYPDVLGDHDIVETKAKAMVVDTPPWEDEKPVRQIFVFGSNLAGRHGAGAAKEAKLNYGAIYGQGIGLQGDSYAIPTKDGRNGQDLKLPEATLPLDQIAVHVKNFIDFAWDNPCWVYNVQRIGCGLAGYKDEQIAPLFKGAPMNVNLPLGWREIAEGIQPPAPAEPALPLIGIIGTAGRDKSIPMNQAHWIWMVTDANKRLPEKCIAVSGGAAWVDHIAVALFLAGRVQGLRLHLPAPFDMNNCCFVGPRNSAASAANYYHDLFSRAIGENSLAHIKQAIEKGAFVTEQPVGHGYRAMFARNNIVASEVVGLLAYTFGTGPEPADGGTKDTWDKCQGIKLHVPLPR